MDKMIFWLLEGILIGTAVIKTILCNKLQEQNEQLISLIKIYTIANKEGLLIEEDDEDER